MSDTPRTDAVIGLANESSALIDLCRTLERELAALRHQVGRNVDVRREALLDAAKAVCPACAEGRPVEWQEDGTPNWWHENRECRAGAIHELRHVANR